MKSRDELKDLLNYFRLGGVEVSPETDEAILLSCQNNVSQQSLAIKVLSIFGGLLASLAFLGFLFVAGIYDSAMGMFVCGLLCIGAAVAVNRTVDSILMDTGGVAFYLIGYFLFVVGLFQLKASDDTACLLSLVLSLVCLFIARGYILTFLSVLIANGAIMALIIINDRYDFIHIQVIFLSLFVTWYFLKEAKILAAGKPWNNMYEPVRTGLLFSLLGCLACLGKRGLFPLSPYYAWISSIGIVISILIVLFRLFEILHIQDRKDQAVIFILSFLLLLPTAASPAISGSLLIMLLGFLVNHKTGFVLGIASFVYFVSQYYYDLHFTLLTKSILLFASGVLFLLIYFITHKKLVSDEEK